MTSIMLQGLSMLVLSLLLIQVLCVLLGSWKRGRALDNQARLQNSLLEEQVTALLSKSSLPHTENDTWVGWRKFRVFQIEAENKTIKSFYLRPHDGKALPSFLPGQHVTFRLKIPGCSMPVVRCYSLSDSANETRYYRVSIRHQVAPKEAQSIPDGVSSSFFHDKLRVGDVLDLKAPSGKFFLDMAEAGPVVLVAGGIGLTPSMSMLNTLRSENSSRVVFLFYAARNSNDLVMVKQLKTLEQVMPNLTIHYFLAELDRGLNNFKAHEGYLTVEKMFELVSVSANPVECDFYVCGPPAMMNAVVGDLTKHEIDSGRIHFESFGPASVGKLSQPKTTKLNDESRSVEFCVSSKSIQWNASQGTLLEAAESAGVTIDSGCRAGSCGTCLTAVLSGDVDYIEEPDTAVEDGSCLPCIATPRNNIKLNA